MSGRLVPQLQHPSGETESGEQWACWHGLPGEGTGMASQSKGVEVPVGVPGCPRGVGRSQADKANVDRWRLFCPCAQSRQLKRRYQSLALPRCPRHRIVLVEGGEGPPVMGPWPAWPGDSLRAGIGIVLALCRHHTPTLLRAMRAGIPPKAALAGHM